MTTTTTTSLRTSMSVALKDDYKRGTEDMLPQHVHDQHDLNDEDGRCLKDKHEHRIKDK